MVADFRQYYGIDLPVEPTDDDCSRWSLLWYALPRESRTARRQTPELRWSEGEYMRGRNKPHPLKTPAERAEAQQHRDNALAAREDIDGILGMHEGGA